MGVILSWSGDGLTDGSSFDNTVAGSGDNAFDTVVGSFAIRSGGLYSPRIEMNQQSGQHAEFYWDASLPVASYSQHAVRFYAEFTAYPVGAKGQIFSVRDSSNVNRWWMDVMETGLLRLRDTNGLSLDFSNNPLPLNSELRFEGVADGTSVEVYVYKGESTVPIEFLAGDAFDTTIEVEMIRFGNSNNNPTWAKTWWDNMAFSNEAVQIGAINPAPPPESSFSMWNGTTEVPLILEGVWDGSAVVPVVSHTVT